MDSPLVIPEAQPHRPTSVRRRVRMDSNSPEFEFWMLRNPSFPQQNLLSADELFVDGVLLPLRLLSAPSATHRGAGDSDPSPDADPDPDESESAPPDPEFEPCPGPKITSSSSLSPSKRWRDIFRKSDKSKEQKNVKNDREDKDKEKKKERKCGTGSTSSAELNINIWPFSRSRSAGNASNRPKAVFGAPGSTRKANSAPCSRSNSAGESKSRKWPASPARPGVHLGRSSPVWKVRRNSGGKGMETLARNAEKMGPKRELLEIHRTKATAAGDGGVSGKAKVLNLNVPICMGYRNQLSCRSDENSTLGVGSSGGAGKVSRGSGGVGTGGGGRDGGGVRSSVGSGGNLFNFRSLFTKKVY